MKTVRVVALLAAALFIFATGAQAQAPRPFLPSYFSVSLGAYVPEGADLDEDNFDAETGFAGLLNFGYMMNPFFGVQTDVGYFETSGDKNFQVSAIPIAVSVKFGIPIAFFEPYVLGGGGVYFCQSEYDLGPVTTDDNSTEFAPHAAGGFNLNFGRFQLGAEARYIWLDVEDLNVDGLLVMGKIGSRF